MKKNHKKKKIDMGAIKAIYGSYHGWQVSQYRIMKKKPERLFLKTVRTMLQTKSLEKGVRMNQKRIELLNGDIELMAYFASVDRNGADCWKDEEARVRKLMQQRNPKKEVPFHKTGSTEFDGAENLSLECIKDLLPLWKSWGRLLILYGS
jgi:hypothetical protein